MSERVISKEDDGVQGRYLARLPGLAAQAELTYRHQGPGVISADHTGVPDEMAGRGVAKALLNALVDDARQSGFRIVPRCSFIRAQYAKHPEWSALFTVPPGVDP
jgi:predicted GNAT family acetyltransferase